MLILTTVTAFLHQGFSSTLKNLIIIQMHPGRLISDFTQVGGAGAALLNAVLVSSMGLFLVYINKVSLSGPTLAAFFTIFGFGLFGKTPLNILSIFIGVYFSSRIIGQPFHRYILIALFGSALGPLVTYVVFELGIAGFPAIIAGFAVGIIAGMLLPPIAKAMLHMHQGYNLYNIGFTCGFLGLFAAGVIEATGRSLAVDIIWNTTPAAILRFFIPVLSLFFIIAGFLEGREKTISDLMLIQKRTGRLPSDFIDRVSQGGTLLNMGLLGIAGWIYVAIAGGSFNGPVLGGILTIIGFGAFGKHLKNSLPVVLGVVLACLIFRKNPADPGPMLAALFVTTLAPIAGEFGYLAGITAGFIHLLMVERTALWHGGFDLYNNGFAGGLTATLLISVIEWFKEERVAIN